MPNLRQDLLRAFTLAAAVCITLSGRSAAGQRATPPSFRALSAGDGFTCGVTKDDRAWCWGANYFGQLGTPNTRATCGDNLIEHGACSRVAIPVSGDIRFASVRAGKTHACGVDVEGTAWCWGDASRGQLGTREVAEQCTLDGKMLEGFPPLPCSRVPVRVESDVRFVAVDVGDEMSCALDERGHAWCWGWRGGDPAPVQVPLEEPVTSLDVGGHRACGVTPEGSARCWSWPDVLESRVVLPVGEAEWGTIAVAAAHICALGMDASISCFGNDADGALGRGRGDHRRFDDATLAPVAGTARFHSVALSSTRSCGVDASGALLCWGRLGSRLADDRCLASNGYAGSNDCTSVPVRMPTAEHVRGVTLGESHGCVIGESGKAACWGSNDWGELGDGTRLASASLSYLATRDRSSSPSVWLREHWPSRATLRIVAAALVACLLVAVAFRWRRRRGPRPATPGMPADPGGVIAMGLVAAGWAVLIFAFVAPSSSSGAHDDVALGLAWMAIFILGAISCVIVAVGGGVAIATLRRDRSATLARVALVSSAITLGGVLVAWVTLLR